MSNPVRTAGPQSEQLPQDLSDLEAAIRALEVDDRRKILPILERVIDSTKRRRRILGLVQDALGQLRLDMKYLVFDLEATRRERDQFRRGSEEA